MRSLLVLVSCAAVAHAQPTDFVARPITLADGELVGELTLGINLAPRLVGEPTSLAPDLWIGAGERWTVGVIHSLPSVDRFAPSATLCVRQAKPGTIGCDSTYTGSGVDLRVGVLEGSFAVAPRVRFLIRDLDPAKPALTLGALLRWTRGRFAITGDPYLQAGLANTELGNRSALFLPVAFAVQPLRRWELALRTGYNTDLAVWRDGWHMPVVFATRVAATTRIDAGAMFAFASLVGPQNTAKERALFFTVSWGTGPRAARSP